MKNNLSREEMMVECEGGEIVNGIISECMLVVVEGCGNVVTILEESDELRVDIEGIDGLGSWLRNALESMGWLGELYDGLEMCFELVGKNVSLYSSIFKGFARGETMGADDKLR